MTRPWHARNGGKEQGTPNATQVAALRASAERLFGDEVRNWTSKREARASGDDRYMSQVLRSGTMADKVAAMTLMVQESPIHRLETLDSLLSTAKAGKHTAKMAIDSLKEVFSSRSGLPGDRRLVTFESRPPLPQSSERQVLWLFEEKLKQRYASFVNVVQGYLKHSASELRRFAAETCAHLLKSKPEQEAELLALLVNKLGDPDPSVSARASQFVRSTKSASGDDGRRRGGNPGLHGKSAERFRRSQGSTSGGGVLVSSVSIIGGTGTWRCSSRRR